MDNYNCFFCKKDFDSANNPLIMYLECGVDLVEFSEPACCECQLFVGSAIEDAVEKDLINVKKD